MLRWPAVLAMLCVAAGLGFYWFMTNPAIVPASTLPAHTVDLVNGKTMFIAGGCMSCHLIPDQDDKTRLGGGLGIKSAFGTFYAPNISPDPADGIGNWTEAQFVTALWKGTSPSGTHYFPAFPYTSYQRMALGDVRDLFAYLMTLPPVAGKARDHEVPFPFNIRRNLGIWKFLLLDGRPFQPDPLQSATWNRGAYLVNGPGHCAECHSPRNPLGGIVASQRFAGGPDPEGEGFIPNITQQRLNDWSEQDFEEFLETGVLPQGDSAAGSMRRVIANTAQLPPQDRAAMAHYLKSLPPVAGPARPGKS